MSVLCYKVLPIMEDSRDIQIEDFVYKFNECGYRTKNIDDLDKDFALVFGCSYTEGVGLYQKDIWCEKLCKELEIAIFNLAKEENTLSEWSDMLSF